MSHHLQHAHHHLHQRDNVATAVKVVYVTASPSFDGPIGGYSTGVAEAPSAPATSAAEAPSVPATSAAAMPSSVAASSVETSAVPTSIVAASSSSAVSSIASSSSAPASSTSASFSQKSASPIQQMAASTMSSTAAPTASSSSDSSTGMTTGAQAGLAFGILALVALILGGAFLVYRNRKSKQAAERGEKLDNEKSPFGGNSSAPRLSLGLNEKSGLSAPIPAVTREAENPFADSNKLPEAKLPGLDSIAAKPQEAARSTSPTENANNVHRVQLDFNPSMDDELELRQGQLVRLLHEYDDGWCLCIRLDRSQQGVVPRSCISKSAMKPRPAGPPPAQRPQQSSAPRARSNSSAPRPTSPNTAANGATGPFGEGQYRARSNTVDSKPAGIVSADKLSSSPNNSSPESTSPTLAPTRKPVPGQAV